MNIQQKTKYPLASDSFNFKTNPLSHQVESFNFAVKTPNFLLGDEQGLGKTKQGIDIAIYRKIRNGLKHCLIVCGVNGLKRNWLEEIGKHSNEDAHVLGTRKVRTGKVHYGGSVRDRLEDLELVEYGLLDSFFLITNIETLRNKDVQEKLTALTEEGIIGMAIVDEIHKAKNAESKQGKSLQCLQTEYRLAATGTPIMNNPLDLYTTLKWLGVEDWTYYTFRKRYCELGGFQGQRILGYRNLKELRKKFEGITLRRKKDDVLDLPPKLYHTEYVEMTKKQAQLYSEVRSCILANIHQIKLSPNPLAQLIRLRQVTAHTSIISHTIGESAKIDRLKEMLEDVTSNGHKALVFSNWTNVTDILERELSQYNPAIITGKVKDIDAEKHKFQNDPECKVAIGTIGVMGTGHTLTEASYVFFVDKPWNKANEDQCSDRAHRIGTKDNVTVVSIVCEDTIDERIEEIIAEKAELSLGLVEGDEDVIEKLNVDTDELLDRLLS